MVALFECISCQGGDHSGHIRVIQGVPEGMLGGVLCPCEGQCEDNAEERRAALAAGMPTPDPEVAD